MKEIVVPGRLTEQRHSSTLDRVHSMRGNIPMPEPSLETAKTTPSRRPQEVSRPGSGLAKEVRDRISSGQTQEEVQAERILKFLSGRNRTPIIAGGADVPENEGWDPNGSDAEAGEIDEASNTPLEHVTGAESLDRELSNIARLVNRDIDNGILRRGDRNSLEAIRDQIKLFRERLVKLPDDQSSSSYNVLSQLHALEGRILGSVVEAGRATEMEKAEHTVAVESKEFDRKYKSLEEALRRGEYVNPAELANYKREKQALVTKIIEVIEDEETPSIEAQRFPGDLLEAALRFRETREILLNEIIFKPYDDVTEQGHYEINFFASGSLDELLAVMSRMAKRSPEDRDIYQKYKGIKTTARNFWEMNRGLWTGNLETFSRIAEEMNYEQFDLMKDLPGVGTVMRLYDQKLFEELGRSGRITAKGFDRVKLEVEKSFREMNDSGLLKSAYYGERFGSDLDRRKFHEWEINRALNVGRVYYNITFRSAEVIAMSQINIGASGKAYTSFPLENAARIMNPILTAERFGIGVEKGGMELWQDAVRANKELMVEDGRHLGKNRFSHINGVKVDDLEFMASFGITGIFSSWRMAYADFSLYEFTISEKGKTFNANLEYIMDSWKREYKGKEVEGLASVIKAIKNDPALSMHAKQDFIKRELDFLIGDNGQMKTGLGTFLRIIQGNAGQGDLGGEVGFEVRKQIWKKIAEENPLAIINILTGLQVKDEHGKFVESKKSLRNILKAQSWISDAEYENQDPNSEGFYLNNPRWNRMKQKLQKRQEIESRKQVDPSYDAEKPALDRDEEVLLEVIRNTVIAKDLDGSVMTEDLADIIFPFMTFMNDTPFEYLTWQNVGNQFFKRRFGDIGQYNSAVSKGVFPLLDNIGGMKPEDVIGAFKELFNGVAGPNGEGSGWNAVLPFELAYLEMALTYAGPTRVAAVKDMYDLFKKETSRLQHFAGSHAASLSEHQVNNFIHHMRHAGVISHHTEQILKKKRKATVGDLVWAFFRDVVFSVGIILTVDTFKSPIGASAK